MILPENEDEWKKLFLVFATAKGKIRKNSLADFININVSGKIAMKLDENDELVSVIPCCDKDNIPREVTSFKCKNLKTHNGVHSRSGRLIFALFYTDNNP